MGNDAITDDVLNDDVDPGEADLKDLEEEETDDAFLGDEDEFEDGE